MNKPSRSWHWPWLTPQGLRVPSLRLYQQIIVLLLVVVLLPLGIATILIYNLNKLALRKQLTSFSQQLAQAVYQDITTEMNWQQRHLVTLQRVANTDPLSRVAPLLFQLDDRLDGIARYRADGTLAEAQYRDFAQLLPEWRFQDPDNGWSHHHPTLPKKQVVLEVVHGTPTFHKQEEAVYYLRAYLPVTNRPGEVIAFQRRFDYLKRLAHQSQTQLYEHLFVVDETGQLMAGPPGLVQQQTRLSAKDNAYFRQLAPGVASVFKTNVADNWQLPDGLPLPPPPGKTRRQTESAREQILDTVFVKIPHIRWGLIIESPYHVQQPFIARARNQTFLIMLAVLALSMGLGLIYIFGVTRNFRQLIKGIKAMTQGNYGRQIRLLTNFATPYEIIFLSGEFNRMARKISEGWRTIQAANQQLAQLDEMKSSLIDTVSHELRTPLTNIKGYTDRLLRHHDVLDETTRRQSLKVIKQQAERLSRLVEDLLVIPDLERHQLRLYLDEVAVVPLLERVIQPFGERGERVVDLRVSPQAGEASILADPDRLEQVMINLIDNACKYGLAGEAVVVVVEQEGNRLGITVSNPCEAIAPEVVPSLFDKFRRLDDGLTRTSRGSGLGLFITRELVEAMGGTITATAHHHRFEVHLTFASI